MDVWQANAVQYLRMSTEHQRYSLESQAAVIADYAAEHSLTVVRTYSDAGRSGLTLSGRPALQQLLSDALNSARNFGTILVLDVSRWGRFQDPDQAAYYEYMCRQAGVRLVYCAEPFENNGDPVSTIVKHLKRVMAGEYSRELSDKISRAQKAQAARGFKQGGSRLFGFRRLQVTQAGEPRAFLPDGETKALKSERVILVPGPAEELAVIRRIFHMFVRRRLSLRLIVRELNQTRGGPPGGRPWTASRVANLLSSELCIGNYVYNRETRSFRAARRDNPADAWIRTHIFPPIVPPRLFREAAMMMETRKERPHYSDEELLRRLRRLLRREGRLTSELVSAAPDLPHVTTYQKRFGTFANACRLVGYEWPRAGWSPKQRTHWTPETLIPRLRRLHAEKGYLSSSAIRNAPYLPSPAALRRCFGSMFNAYSAAGYSISASEVVSGANRRRRQQTSRDAATQKRRMS